jgi:hypothetical protein
VARHLSPARAAKEVKKRKKLVEDVSPYAKILVYARNKSGKTVFGCSAKKHTFVIDIDEEGTRSARGTGATVFEAHSFDEAVWAYWYLKEGNHKFKVVTLDTITALYKAALRKVTGEAEDRDPTREPAMIGDRIGHEPITS